MTTIYYGFGPLVDNNSFLSTVETSYGAWFELIGDVHDAGSIGTGNAKSANSEFSFNTGLSITTGQLVVLVVATDNDSSADGDNNEHLTVTIDGHSMTQILEYTNSEGSADAGVTVSAWYWKATTNVASAVAIVTTLTSGKTAKAASGRIFNIPYEYTVSIDGTQTGGTSAADPESLIATGGNSGKHIWIRGIGVEDNHADVGLLEQTVDWAAFSGDGTEGGLTDSNISVRAEFKISDGTSSGASNPSISSTPDTASVLVGLLISVASTIILPYNVNIFRSRIFTSTLFSRRVLLR